MLFPDEAVVARVDELRRIGYFENHVSAGLGERLERLHEGLRAVRVLEDMARQHYVGTAVARREALRVAGVEGSLQRLESGAAVAHVEIGSWIVAIRIDVAEPVEPRQRRIILVREPHNA